MWTLNSLNHLPSLETIKCLKNELNHLLHSWDSYGNSEMMHGGRRHTFTQIFVKVDSFQVCLFGNTENSRGRFFRTTHARQCSQVKQPTAFAEPGKTEKSTGL